ncbi:MAG TPA: flagellar biosynthesis protein FliQ [Symbiobacteriaceae bacterium]|nr:flagellar biosynthesis protein FliQ [Symbiobacteriaceae bacterium]
MTEDLVLSIGRQALMTVLLVSGPILLFGLVTGVIISVFQATTQINEQTLTFIPKIVVVLATIVLFGPWMGHMMLDFAASIFAMIPQVGP